QEEQEELHRQMPRLRPALFLVARARHCGRGLHPMREDLQLRIRRIGPLISHPKNADHLSALSTIFLKSAVADLVSSFGPVILTNTLPSLASMMAPNNA